MNLRKLIHTLACLLSSVCLSQSNFVVTELSLDGQDIGYGLSLAMWGEQPRIATYTLDGTLLFLSWDGTSWSSETVDTELFPQTTGSLIPDAVQSSLIYHRGVPTIAYFDQSTETLKLARRINGGWEIRIIDGGEGSSAGGYPEIRELAGGEVGICYYDASNASLKLATGSPEGPLVTSTISTTGGEWCSFYQDDTILFSKDGMTYFARDQAGSWQTIATGMPGTQPSGGISADGTAEIYASDPRASWSSLAESDSDLNNYFQPAQEPEPFIGTFGGPGACPDFEPNAGVAFRSIRRSALFGSSVSVNAIIKQNGNDVSTPVAPFGASGLPIIRYVDLERTRKGNFQVAFSYVLHNSIEDKEVIQIASYTSADTFFADSDNDGIDDAWEQQQFGNLTTAGIQSDTDGDGLSDLDEFLLGTQPNSSDTDADGTNDAAEVVRGSDPNAADSLGDSDGLDDAWEINYFGNTDETDDGDFDGDGTSNLAEFRLGLIPNDAHSSFKASLESSAITWQGRIGLSFSIQRSSNLVEWTTIHTQDGVDGTNFFEDPSPPNSTAFYRILLNP